MVISSAMYENNKIELISLKQSNLQHESSKSVPDAISDMKWLDKNSLLVGDLNGRVSFVRLSNGQMDFVQSWPKLKRPITAVSAVNFGELAACVATESGQIALLTLDDKDYVRSYSDDTCVLSLTSISSTTIASGNLFGQMKWWDVRTAEARPERIFSCDEQVGINTLAQHPGRSNLVVGGATDGSLFVWDTRSDKLPLTHIKKHSAPVLELKFHSHRPVAVSCGNDGKMFAYGGDWNGDIEDHDLTPPKLNESINSLDICDDFIAAAGDNGVLSVTQLD